MKKIIIKTALITLGAIVGVCLCVIGVIFAFFPVTVANFYQSTGNSEKALKYSEKAFNKQENSQNLQRVLLACIDADNGEKLQEYYLIYKENDGYAISKDNELYVAGNYCVYLAENGKGDEAIEIASSYFLDYTKSNPYRYLMAYAFENKNDQFLNSISISLSADVTLNYSKLSTEAKALVYSDLKSIADYFSNDNNG